MNKNCIDRPPPSESFMTVPCPTHKTNNKLGFKKRPKKGLQVSRLHKFCPVSCLHKFCPVSRLHKFCPVSRLHKFYPLSCLHKFCPSELSTQFRSGHFVLNFCSSPVINFTNFVRLSHSVTNFAPGYFLQLFLKG